MFAQSLRIFVRNIAPSSVILVVSSSILRTGNPIDTLNSRTMSAFFLLCWLVHCGSASTSRGYSGIPFRLLSPNREFADFTPARLVEADESIATGEHTDPCRREAWHRFLMARIRHRRTTCRT